jgi:Uma2 family endonuclease
MSAAEQYLETITLPRAVRFPVELNPPEGFDPERPSTWPSVAGRLEWVDGRLLFMPPCSDLQQDTVIDVVIALGTWARAHRAFVVGGNEAGMRLGGDTRAADVAVWRRSELGAYSGRLRTVAPVLAVEVGGPDDTEDLLSAKASWYLGVGVAVVWLVLPASREVVVVTKAGASRCSAGDRLPAHRELPDLAPEVADLFVQVAAPSTS